MQYSKGVRIYLTGGAVRDKLLGREPKDRDYVIVGATDTDVAKMLEDGFTQVGADFPVFLHPETGDEYALARIERKSGAGYHGFTVKADSSVTIEDDLARRDLTVNSMAMDDNDNIVDPFNGIADLHNHVLRHTTEAFAEDPLRVLRLARFAARFADWTVAKETVALCKKISASGELNDLSIERIWVEMEKAFSEKAPHRFMEVLEECDAISHCEVLSRLFSPFGTMQHTLARALPVVPKEQRLYVAVGVLSQHDVAMCGGPSRAQECFLNISGLAAAQTAEDLLGVLKRARAHQESPQFNDLLMAVLVHERAGYGSVFNFTFKQLLTAQHIILQVRAADFDGIAGKELGAAIEQKRIRELEVGLNIPTVVLRKGSQE